MRYPEKKEILMVTKDILLGHIQRVRETGLLGPEGWHDAGDKATRSYIESLQLISDGDSNELVNTMMKIIADPKFAEYQDDNAENDTINALQAELEDLYGSIFMAADLFYVLSQRTEQR